MVRLVTIDGAGRLVVPKDLRDRHGLRAGSRLTLVEREDGIFLTPRPMEEPRLIERGGLLVVAASEPTAVPDHRELREERLAKIG